MLLQLCIYDTHPLRLNHFMAHIPVSQVYIHVGDGWRGEGRGGEEGRLQGKRDDGKLNKDQGG